MKEADKHKDSTHEHDSETGDNIEWMTDEEILQGDSMPPYYDSYAMQKWAGLGWPECYSAKEEPEKYARRRRIYYDYRDGLRPLQKNIGLHQIKLKKYLDP